MAYTATVYDSSGTGYSVSNTVYNAAGTPFVVNASVYDAAGNPHVIFTEDTITTNTPADRTFIATDDRVFTA